MWISNADLSTLTDEFKRLIEEKVAALTKPTTPDSLGLKICGCGHVFVPRPPIVTTTSNYNYVPQSFNPYAGLQNYFSSAQVKSESTVYDRFCSHCLPAELERERAVTWAKANPDKATICMKKHKGRGK